MAHILIVDDDKNILRLLDFALSRAGHTITTAEDGVQGLAQIKAQSPDLIVADVMMPKMTGYEFCRQVRQTLGLTETPIIVFSARFQPIDKQTALEAGASDFLPKTTSPDVLIKRIAELLPAQATPTTQVTVALFSLRGGVGVTSLAVNLAVALALTKKTPTTLLDLTPLGGHAALMLGLRPTSSVSDVLYASGDQVTLDKVKPHLIQHATGVQLLASTLNYDHILHLNDTRLEKLVAALQSAYAYTVVDVPHILEPRFGRVLQLFDKIILVISPDMPSLQSAAMALQGLNRLELADEKVILIVNQLFPNNAIPLDVIQMAVKRPILATIPFEGDMFKAVNNGKPLLLNSPQSPASMAIARLAANLFG